MPRPACHAESPLHNLSDNLQSYIKHSQNADGLGFHLTNVLPQAPRLMCIGCSSHEQCLGMAVLLSLPSIELGPVLDYQDGHQLEKQAGGG